MVRGYRRAKQRPIYYKTECLACEIIINVKWERPYVGVLPTHGYIKTKKACPFCQGTQIKTFQIRKVEYCEIEQHWDMIMVAEND